jgi:hypothetical protein
MRQMHERKRIKSSVLFYSCLAFGLRRSGTPTALGNAIRQRSWPFQLPVARETFQQTTDFETRRFSSTHTFGGDVPSAFALVGLCASLCAPVGENSAKQRISRQVERRRMRTKNPKTSCLRGFGIWTGSILLDNSKIVVLEVTGSIPVSHPSHDPARFCLGWVVRIDEPGCRNPPFFTDAARFLAGGRR